MANENMIKFLRGNVANLPQTATAGALYFTKDEGVYLGLEDGSYHRYGDFIIVDSVSALPAAGANATCMYYCTSENILARYDSVKGWVQINKQPTAEEMKTLLGLKDLAYLSEVGESNLSAALLEKVNASAEGNHSHSNKGVLDGITAEKVAAWDASEGNSKTYADGLNTAMNGRVEALEAIDHEHSNKALLDTYTQTEENLADAVAKKHEHSNKTELDKIVAGDVAKWNGVVADHLVAADKTALEDSIGDVNTALGEEVTRAKAAEKVNADAISGIKNGSSINDFAGVESTLSGKVDKVEGKSLISDSEITRLASVTNYDDTQVKADIATKASTEYVNTELGKKVDKVEGYSLVSDTEIARLANVDNYDDTQVKADIAKKADSATMTTELGKKVDKVEGYSLVSDTEIARLADVDNYDDGEVRDLIADRYTKEEADGKFALIADAYDDSELAGRVKAIEDDYLVGADKTELAGLVTAEKERAEGIEAGLRTDVDAIKADYLKAADKQALQTQIDTIMNNPDTEGVINSINEFTQYIEDHGEIADGFRTDIDKNKEDIAAEVTRATGAEEALSGRLDVLEAIDHDAYKGYADQAEADAKAYTDAEIAKDRARLDTLEAIDHEAYKAADATLKSELQAEIDADVKALADGQVTTNKNDIADIMEMLTWGTFGE